MVQNFNKVRYDGLTSWINYHHQITEQNICLGTVFRVKFRDYYSCIREIKADIPRESELSPVLYLIYRSDNLWPANAILATVAYYTLVVCVSNGVVETTKISQKSVDNVFKWTNDVRQNQMKQNQHT